MMKKTMASVAILLGALSATAGSAAADPSPFGALGCTCDSVTGIPTGTPDVKDQVDQGFHNGLGSLHRTRGS